jgi:hypothetical protein
MATLGEPCGDGAKAGALAGLTALARELPSLGYCLGRHRLPPLGPARFGPELLHKAGLLKLSERRSYLSDHDPRGIVRFRHVTPGTR